MVPYKEETKHPNANNTTNTLQYSRVLWDNVQTGTNRYIPVQYRYSTGTYCTVPVHTGTYQHIYNEIQELPLELITSELSQQFKVVPYKAETKHPMPHNATNTLQYSIALWEMVNDWATSTHHQKTPKHPLLSNRVPPGLRIKSLLDILKTHLS